MASTVDQAIYRGLRVPDELRGRWDSAEAYWWRRGVDQAINTTSHENEH